MIIFGILLFVFPLCAGASDGMEKDKDINGLLENLDTSEMDNYLSQLDRDEKLIFDSGSVTERIKEIINGDIALDAGNFFVYICELIGLSAKKILPFLSTVLAICIACAVINSIKGRFASESVGDMVGFIFSALIIVILSVQVSSLVLKAKDMVNDIEKQINIFFPVIITLMAGSGATTTAGVYQPMIAIFGTGITRLMVNIIFPLIIASLVFGFISGISSSIKLKKLSDFFINAVKWLMSVSFFIFLAYMGVQGITASVYDNVSVRMTKFALGNYVPIIGGYLSDGLGVIISGSVLIKNAVGMCAIVLLLISVIPVILQIIIFGLSLNFLAAVAEPLGCEQVSTLLSQIGKSIKTIVACLFGVTFLYFIFIILVVLTGNLII